MVCVILLGAMVIGPNFQKQYWISSSCFIREAIIESKMDAAHGPVYRCAVDVAYLVDTINTTSVIYNSWDGSYEHLYPSAFCENYIVNQSYVCFYNPRNTQEVIFDNSVSGLIIFFIIATSLMGCCSLACLTWSLKSIFRFNMIYNHCDCIWNSYTKFKDRNNGHSEINPFTISRSGHSKNDPNSIEI